MLRRPACANWTVRLGLAGGLLALAVAAFPARSQDRPDLSKTKTLTLAVVATATNDAQALKAAQDYFGNLDEAKDDPADATKNEPRKKVRDEEKARTDKSQPPDFPPAPPPAASAAEVAAAAAVPPLGLGEQVAAQVTLAQASAPRPGPQYRWVRVDGDRELTALNLDPSAAKANPKLRGRFWKEAEENRQKKQAYAHSDTDWVMFSREGKGGAVEFFVLVKVPEARSLVTERDVDDVLLVRNQDRAAVSIILTPGGAKQLEQFTQDNKPDSAGVTRYATLIRDDRVIELFRVTHPISIGRFEVGYGRKKEELDVLFRLISEAKARK